MKYMVKYSKGRMIGGTMETVGLLAGIGILPVEFIEAAHIQGYKVVCIAVIPGVEKKLKEKRLMLIMKSASLN